jgi:hypothetical protein
VTYTHKHTHTHNTLTPFLISLSLSLIALIRLCERRRFVVVVVIKNIYVDGFIHIKVLVYLRYILVLVPVSITFISYVSFNNKSLFIVIT